MSKSLETDILIATSSLDSPSWLPVARYLSNAGFNVVPFESDRVISGEIPFSLSLDSSSGLKIFYEGLVLDLSRIAAAWRRRPNMYPSDRQGDPARQIQLDDGRRLMSEALWSQIPEDAWLNSPNA